MLKHENSKPVQRWSGKLRVDHIVDETPTVKTFRLVHPQNKELPFTFLPGQFLTLTVQVDGKSVRRSFSLASSPLQKDHVDITMKLEEGGILSHFAFGQTRVGDLWPVTAPYGFFTFTGSEAESIVLIGGGVGVSPLMGITRHLTAMDWQGAIYLFCSFRNVSEYLYQQELETLDKEHEGLHLLTTLTREPGSSWQGRRGRLSVEETVKSVPTVNSCRIHICGPRPMIDAFKQGFLQLGIPKDQLRTESFGPTRRLSK